MQVSLAYFDRIGANVIRSMLSVHGSFMLLVRSLGRVASLLNPEIRKVFYRQLYFTGVESVIKVSIIGALLGIVIITQISNIAGSNPLLIGKILVWTVVRELGPLFAAILIIARSSTAMASELGSMKAGGEIDSLQTMGIDPYEYLIVPRVFGVVLSVVILTFYFQVAAVLGGLVISTSLTGAAMMPLLKGIFSVVGLFEIIIAFVKSLVFGMIIAAFSCYHGLRVKDSITEIPQVTSHAVIQSLTLVIIFDVLITLMSFV